MTARLSETLERERPGARKKASPDRLEKADAPRGEVPRGDAYGVALPSSPRPFAFTLGARQLLESRRLKWMAVVLAMLLTSTAINLEQTADDHFHSLALRDSPGIQGVKRAPWDIFSFAKDSSTNLLLMEEGVLPWWSDRQVVLSFLRPITSLSHWIDHTLWPDQPVVMHLHSMAWFAALLLVVWRLHREHGTTVGAAGLAFLLYAVDDARAMTVGWISNRNALIALTFGFLALLSHHAWRSQHKTRHAWIGAGALCVALLAGEAALQVFGYLVAYALFRDPASRYSRIRSLAPYLAVIVAWRLAYVMLGYGASGSDFYIDPGRDPIAFSQNILLRLPVLLLAQFAVPFADLWDGYAVFAPALRVVVPLVGLLVLAGLARLIRPLLVDTRLRFWCAGTLFSTLPVCSVSPSDRLLTATGVGGAAIVGTLLFSFLERSDFVVHRMQRVLVYGLALVHLVLAPLLLPIRTKGINLMGNMIAHSAESIPAAALTATKTLVLLNPPAEPFAGYFPLYREAKNLPRPRYFRWLTTGLNAFDLERVDRHTVTIRPEGGFLSNDAQWLFRSRAHPFRRGERIELSELTIEITEVTADGRPAEIAARFQASLDGEQVTFMQWGVHDYVPFEVPSVGKRVHIPKVDLESALLMAPSTASSDEAASHHLLVHGRSGVMEQGANR